MQNDPLKSGFKSQYHAAFSMLKDCIDQCPDEIWTRRKNQRAYWKIVYHSLYFTHMYLMESEQKFVPWTKHVDENDNLYDEIIKGNEPTPYTKVEMLEYLAICDGLVDGCVDAIDFTAIDCGFSWYNMPKFNHQLVNLRHIMAHQGQLSEILNENGIDTKWFGGSYPKS